MSKMNFAIALKMSTDQFKRGANIAKNALKQIQFQVIAMAGALGLGSVGLKNMVSRFVDVARETTRARVALRNISGDAQGFTNNMDFLIKASGKWGQELNGMTTEFAKFSAAASSAGIPIQEQHTIFESFTRSITAFGMSSEDAHLSYLALSQMMSKGKISSEELRRQLGERMPVAMEAMARAVGVTIQELDGLLKAGKLISKDVMMPFVKEMEKMLPEVNVDNIETSVNRLKNTFTQLVQDLKIGEYFKKIVDWANGMLSNIQTSFLRVFSTIAAAIVGGKLFKAYAALTQHVKVQNAKIVANKLQTEQQLEIAVAKRVAAEKRYNDTLVLYNKASDDEKLRSYSKLTAAKSTLDKTRLKEQAGLKAVEAANSAKSLTMWTAVGNSFKKMWISTISVVKTAFSTLIPMAVIGLLTNFVMKLVEARKEAQRIKNIYKDNVGSIFNVADTSEIQRIKTLHKIIKERIGTEEQIESAQLELNRLLGIEEGKQVDINKEVSKRISLLREAARADLAAQNNAQLEQRNREIIQKIAPNGDAIAVRQFYDKSQRIKASMGGSLSDGAYYSIGKEFGLNTGNRFSSGDFANLIREFEQNAKSIDYNNTLLENAVRSGIELSGGGGGGGGGGDEKGKETPLQKAEQKYAEEILKLTNQKQAGVINTEEYNKAIDDLNKTIYEEIGGILGSNSTLNETFLKAKQGVENPLTSFSELGKLNDEYNKSLKELIQKQELGLITEDDYNKELLDLINATASKIASFENVTDAEKEYIENLKQIAAREAKSPIKEDRDKTFDYKKSESDILAEDYNLQEDFLDKLQAQYDNTVLKSAEALAQIEEESANLTNLGDALRFAEIKEDLKEINMSLLKGAVDGFTGLADAIDRAASAWKRLENWDDMSDWEKTVAVINAVGDSIKGLMGTWEAYMTLRDLISARKQVIQARDNVNTAQSIANTVAESAAEKAAATTNIAGNVAEATTEATISAAKLPFPANIAAVGLAAAAVYGILSSFAKFEKGGIVGGLKGGDRNLVRVNGGEMIMTTAQQSKLWNAVQKGEFGGGGGDVRFVIEGTKLVGILNQVNSKQSRI